MNNSPCKALRKLTFDMHPIIEPLASVICAAEQPGLVLKHALEALYIQIEQTNRTANAHLESFWKTAARCWCRV